MDKQTNEWTDEVMDRRTDGQTDKHTITAGLDVSQSPDKQKNVPKY